MIVTNFGPRRACRRSWPRVPSTPSSALSKDGALLRAVAAAAVATPIKPRRVQDFRRQLRPIGTHRRARRAGQFRFRPGTQQPQLQRHDPDGAEQRQPRRDDDNRGPGCEATADATKGGTVGAISAGATFVRHRRRRPLRAVADSNRSGYRNRPPLPNLPQTNRYLCQGHVGPGDCRFATGPTTLLALRFAQRQFFGDVDGARFQEWPLPKQRSNFNTRGPVVSSNTNRQMELNGAFLGQGTQPEFQAGFFSVRRPRYIGGGAYLGEKR